MDTQATVSTSTQDDPRLHYEIRFLELTARGMRACRQLGVRTVQDFLQRDRVDFLRLRNCGAITYDDIAHRVRDFLSSRRDLPAAPDDGDLDRPLRDWVDNPRALRAFQSLGLKTIRQFFDTPKDEILAVRGFGERTYWQVSQQLSQAIYTDTGWSLLPDALLDFSLAELPLPEPLAAGLRGLELATVADLLRGHRSQVLATIGSQGVDKLRACLGEALRVGLGRDAGPRAPEDDFHSAFSYVISRLPLDQRTLLSLRIGLDEPVHRPAEIAAKLDLEMSSAADLERRTLRTLRAQAGEFVQGLRDELERHLRDNDGYIHAERIAKDTPLHAAAIALGDPLLALRLLRFLFPGEVFLYGPLLTPLAPPVYRNLLAEIRYWCTRQHLPMPVRQLEDRLSHVVDPAPTGLLLLLAQTHGQCRVHVDPVVGQVLRLNRETIGDRIARILEESDRPKTLEDILFIYRDLHRVGNMSVLLDYLRKDPRFIEVGRATWNLRSAHEDELSLIRPIAEETIADMLWRRERRNILDLHSNADVPERRVYLQIVLMREDSRLRYLGRGMFCIPGEKSAVMEDIRESMHRAMGEIVRSRFIDNQPRARRRLAECLLRENRALVETAPDRVDLLSNYPFNAERLQRLIDLVAEQLDTGRGFATAAEILEIARQTDLAGNWLNEHMLLDMMRRHADFELLPAGIIAQAHLGLAGWIQHRIRTCLRKVRQPMTKEQVIVEAPDLAAFQVCIEALIEADPMVHSVDGVHHSLR